MHQMKICVVSGSRAEFGQLLPLLVKLEEDPEICLDFVVTGSHLNNTNGNTISEINDYPIHISKCIPVKGIENNTREGIVMQIGSIMHDFAVYLSENVPDIVVVIGDRYEMFSVATAASTLLIPIAHICGGSTTSGAIDEVYRHSISKMSSLHFTTCEAYRKRVIQLGENPDCVYNVGSLAIENCLNTQLTTEAELRKFVGLPEHAPYCVVTFHPVTLEKDSCEIELYSLIEALDSFPEYSYIITLSNADAGGYKINEIWKREGDRRANYYIVPSLGMKRYLSALKYSEMMIGNSSSGTTEGPAMHIPTIDIGDRQKGRFFSKSIIHCEPKTESIVSAIKKANNPEFRAMVMSAKNPFGDGDTSSRIVEILKHSVNSVAIKKDFYDIEFEVNK